MEQHKVTTTAARLLLVEVPEHSHHHKIENGYLTFLNLPNPNDVMRELPAGQYTLIGVTDLTEEQAAMVVDICVDGNNVFCGYMEYTPHYQDGQGGYIEDYGPYETAVDSFASLLRSHSLTGRFAVLKIDV